MLHQNGAVMDDTMRSLLRDRLQTSIDGVVRGAECSRSVASTNSLLRSRAGVLALICWLAAYSCSPPAPSHQKSSTRLQKRSSSLSRFNASQRILNSAMPPAGPASSSRQLGSVPRKAAVLRSIHTTARPRTTPHLPAASLSQTAQTGSVTNESPSTAKRAGLSSLTHPPSRPNTWLDRLVNSLASLVRASEHHADHNTSRSDAPPQSRQRTRGVGRIHNVMQDPRIYDPIVLPRHPIVLCHGLYGFDVRGPFLGLEIHYWAKTLDILRKKMGVEVLVHGVPPTGSIKERAESLHEFLISDEAGVRGKKLNFVAHSMGGLDVRHLLTHIRPKKEEYVPVSLTTISTPHRGSPFMDWCNANIGIGNDYIEEAIQEARKERAHLADRDTQGPRVTKVPYSLKSPIFTRPKPLSGSSLAKKRSDEPVPVSEGSTTETLFNAASTVVSTLTSSEAASAAGDAAEKVKAAVKQSQSKDGSLPFGLSSFLGSLSTLTGSFSSYMLSLLDTPAYAMLSTRYMNEVFNPRTPNVPGVKYYSVASRTPSLAIWHPLWLPKLILDAAAESRTAGGEIDGSADALGGADQGNDGLVSVESAKWGEFLGVMEGCDHWDMRGGGAPRWSDGVNPSTGKPWPVKAQETQRREKQGESWIDINRLLFSKSQPEGQGLTSFQQLSAEDGWNGVSLRDPEVDEDGEKRADEADGEETDGAVSSFSPQHDDTLVQEIAAWISDRLPLGNAERRAIAEQRDKLIEQNALTLYHPAPKDVSSNSGITDFVGSSNGTSSARQEQVAALSTTPSASASTKREAQEGETQEKKKRKELSELERFWIALCRHLHDEGH